MSSSFQNKKQIRIIITVYSGVTFSGPNNQIILEGFRTSVDIDKGGGQMMGTLRASIYGMSQANMKAATTLMWGPRSLKPNTVEVHALDGTQDTIVFQGNIVSAWGNYQSMPDVFLQIQAQAAYFNQVNPATPTSYKGTIDVATVIGQLAKQMGYVFENNGVSVQLSNPYLPNTALEQVKSLVQQANIDLYLDNNVLAITPSTAPRNKLVVEVSDASGLVGYPTFDGVGVNFQILFNPALTFGGPVKVVSSIPRASGIWTVANIAHKLESEKQGGAWFSTVRGNQNGLAVTH